MSEVICENCGHSIHCHGAMPRPTRASIGGMCDAPDCGCAYFEPLTEAELDALETQEIARGGRTRDAG